MFRDYDDCGAIVQIGLLVDSKAEILWTPERQAIRLLSDPAPHMVWLADANGLAIYVNPQWSAVTGQTHEEALGYGWLNVIHPQDKEAALAGFTSARIEHLPFHTDYRIQQADGQYQAVPATSSPLFDAAGQYIGYVGANTLSEAAGAVEEANARPVKSFILSRRERAVLTWVAAGLTAEEIGGKLQIAPRTVEFHIHSSARKLRSSNRVQTVAKAAVFGEIDLSRAINL